MTDRQNPIPVTIVAGFLGAGKTTMVNHILSGAHGERCLVMVNDFGQINIDTMLIKARSENVVSLENGCICCTVQNDMVAQLGEMLGRSDEPFPDRIVIETSGLSDPAKVAQAVNYPQFRGRLRTDAVVVLVDAAHFAGLDDDARRVAQDQIAAVDIIILNKADLTNQADLNRFRHDWGFPGVRVMEAVNAVVPFQILFGSATRAVEEGDHSHEVTDQRADGHTGFSTWSWRGAHRFSAKRLRTALKALPAEVFRGKGVVLSDDPDTPAYIFHLVGHRVDFSRIEAGRDIPDVSSLVFIGQREAMKAETFEPVLKTANSAG